MYRYTFNKKQEKLIDSLIEQKKTLWAAMIVLSGGLAGLILSLTFPLISLVNLSKLFLLIIGFYFDYISSSIRGILHNFHSLFRYMHLPKMFQLYL